MHEQAAALLAEALTAPALRVSRHARACMLLVSAACATTSTDACAAWSQARDLADALDATVLRCEARLGLAAASPSTTTSRDDLTQAHALARRAGLPSLTLRTLVAGADAAAAHGDRSHADHALREALAQMDRSKVTGLGGPGLLATCARIADAVADPGLADALRARARQRLRSILLDLDEPAWRVAYGALPAHRALLA